MYLTFFHFVFLHIISYNGIVTAIDNGKIIIIKHTFWSFWNMFSLIRISYKDNIFRYWLDACVQKDDDNCLKSSPNFGDPYTCANSIQYCSEYPKDMKRCCPESCDSGIFTRDDCNSAKGIGDCNYTNITQCHTKGCVLKSNNTKYFLELLNCGQKLRKSYIILYS